MIPRRLEALWDYRFTAAHDSDDPSQFADELSSFGWWFSSGKFEPEWSLGELTRMFEQIGDAVSDHRADHLVAEELELLAPRFPEEAVACLHRLVDATDSRHFIGWRDHARRVLESAIASSSNTAGAEASKVANKFGALGYEEFRDFAE